MASVGPAGARLGPVPGPLLADATKTEGTGAGLAVSAPESVFSARPALADARPEERSRWTDRTLLELLALMLAILVPPTIVYLVAEGGEEPYLMPFASLGSAVLVMVLSAVATPFAWSSQRSVRASHWLEVPLAVGGGLLFAFGWVSVLQAISPELEEESLLPLVDAVGLAGALFVVALVPAFVEEIAFRGVLQARLLALFGARTALLLGATMFALCHVAPMALPIHLGLGLYLGWLRNRSGSLLPGMAVHAAYNASILLIEAISRPV